MAQIVSYLWIAILLVVASSNYVIGLQLENIPIRAISVDLKINTSSVSDTSIDAFKDIMNTYATTKILKKYSMTPYHPLNVSLEVEGQEYLAQEQKIRFTMNGLIWWEEGSPLPHPVQANDNLGKAVTEVLTNTDFIDELKQITEFAEKTTSAPTPSPSSTSPTTSTPTLNKVEDPTTGSQVPIEPPISLDVFQTAETIPIESVNRFKEIVAEHVTTEMKQKYKMSINTVSKVEFTDIQQKSLVSITQGQGARLTLSGYVEFDSISPLNAEVNDDLEIAMTKILLNPELLNALRKIVDMGGLVTVDTSPVASPTESNPVESPTVSSPIESPTISVPVEPPIESSPVEPPTESSPVASPTESSPVESPTESSPVASPVESSPVASPTTSSSNDGESSNESNSNEITETMTTAPIPEAPREDSISEIQTETYESKDNSPSIVGIIIPVALVAFGIAAFLCFRKQKTNTTTEHPLSWYNSVLSDIDSASHKKSNASGSAESTASSESNNHPKSKVDVSDEEKQSEKQLKRINESQREHEDDCVSSSSQGGASTIKFGCDDDEKSDVFNYYDNSLVDDSFEMKHGIEKNTLKEGKTSINEILLDLNTSIRKWGLNIPVSSDKDTGGNIDYNF